MDQLIRETFGDISDLNEAHPIPVLNKRISRQKKRHEEITSPNLPASENLISSSNPIIIPTNPINTYIGDPREYIMEMFEKHFASQISADYILLAPVRRDFYRKYVNNYIMKELANYIGIGYLTPDILFSFLISAVKSSGILI